MKTATTIHNVTAKVTGDQTTMVCVIAMICAVGKTKPQPCAQDLEAARVIDVCVMTL